MKKIVVVSLCDGISIRRYALEQLGYEVDYYRAEIKETANRVAITQFSDSHNLGDVTKVSYNDGVLHSELGDYQLDHIDMVIFGSPCQNFSRAMHTEDRMGFEGSKSSLFYECLRILQECNPDFYFMENVIMKKEDQDAISNMLGVQPVRINDSYFTAALRDRLYWANWKIDLPEDHGTKLQNIFMNGYTDRDRARALLVSDSRPLTTPVIIIDEAQCLSNKILDDLRIIFNFSMDSENPYILILAGQTPLRNRLQMGINTPLRQRITVKYHMQGLQKDELKEYIQSRLKIAGAMDADIFSDSALDSIYTITKGAPRVVNNLVTGCLMYACASQIRRINEETVYQANRDIEL